MAKVVTRYKGKVYVNEANYSAGLLMADVWKDTVKYNVGDIFRIVHRGKKIPNRIHLERVPIQDSISLIKIWMYYGGGYSGSYIYSIPITPLLNLIQERFEYRPFLSRTFTTLISNSQDREIKKIMDEMNISDYKKISLGGESLRKLNDRGYLDRKRDGNLIYYQLLEEPIVEKSLHHLYGKVSSKKFVKEGGEKNGK